MDRGVFSSLNEGCPAVNFDIHLFHHLNGEEAKKGGVRSRYICSQLDFLEEEPFRQLDVAADKVKESARLFA